MPPASRTLDTIVLGGGIAGLMAASAMQTTRPRDSCVVFEAESDLGGLIRDVTFSPETGMQRINIAYPQQVTTPVVPIGGVRVDPSQFRVLELHDHFAIKSTPAKYRDVAVVDGVRTEEADVMDFPETREIAQAFRFVGDFEATDQARYVEFCKHDVFDDTNRFARKGWSEFAQKTAKSFTDAGGSFQLNMRVKTVDFDKVKQHYIVTFASGEIVHATTCIIAIPPRALRSVGGNVVNCLNAEPFMRQSRPVPVTTVTMWFNDTWWKKLDFHRVWDHSNQLHHLELFNTPGNTESKAIRISYADGATSEIFGDQAGKPEVDAWAVEEMLRSLRDMFPEVADDISQPLHTHVEHFADAWYFEFRQARLSMIEKHNLAADLSALKNTDVLGAKLHLVGCAYAPERAWVNGAVHSVRDSMRFLVPEAGSNLSPFLKGSDREAVSAESAEWSSPMRAE
jgi:glycine/D-amino acid oxidase-like deaminating enzyme